MMENKIGPVNLNAIIEAIGETEDNFRCYMDKERLNLLWVDTSSQADPNSSTYKNAAQLMRNPEQYIALPVVNASVEREINREFIASITDRKLRENLSEKANELFKFNDLLDKNKLWADYDEQVDDYYRELAIQWCDENNIAYGEAEIDDGYYDDPEEFDLPSMGFSYEECLEKLAELGKEMNEDVKAAAEALLNVFVYELEHGDMIGTGNGEWEDSDDSSSKPMS
ncbi:MAG: hypothetical protein K6D03_00910 [Solobacterium sp.]|nr:hypothetical protein [Solobacterium sp.]